MPRKPKHPCSYPSCPRLTDSRYCEEHAKLEARCCAKYDRDPASRHRYVRAWKRIRDRYIAAHPLRRECLKAGRYTPAKEVGHKLPFSQGGTHAVCNLIVLCKSYHSRITAKMGDRWHDR